jgi:glycosyltransferase involved in cell wall biosynthesis
MPSTSGFRFKIDTGLKLNNATNHSDLLSTGTILFLTSSYPKAMGEPSGIFLHYLAKELRKAGWRVIVLAPNFPDGKKVELLEGVEVERFNYFIPKWQALCYRSGMLPNLRGSPWLWLQVPFFLGSMFYSAAKLLRKERIDLLHAHWVLPQGVVASLIQLLFKIPVVLTVHGGDVFAFGDPVGSFFKHIALKKATACTANSSFTQRAIQDFNRRLPVRIIPMGVDVNYFHPRSTDQDLRKQLQIEGEMILFVGRLVKKKGAQHLLQAMPSVIESFPQVVLVVIGEGIMRGELEEMAEQLRITSSVRFLGRISNADLPKYYTAADLFIGPSVVDDTGDTEGLGIVFLEAAASEVAIIGTAVGGISDVLIDGVTGIQIEPANPEQLAREIKRVLQDSELRRKLVGRARHHVVEHFSWSQIAARFSTLFHEVISGRLAQ